MDVFAHLAIALPECVAESGSLGKLLKMDENTWFVNPSIHLKAYGTDATLVNVQ